MNRKPIAIIGVGNLLMGDEGVGIHAIQYLRDFDWPENCELIDAGTPGATLLHLIDERELTIVIDCGDFKGKPGEVLVVDVDELKKPEEHMISMHGTSLLGTLELGKHTGLKTGKVMLVCIQPKTVEMTDKLSEEVKNSLDNIKDKVSNILA